MSSVARLSDMVPGNYRLRALRVLAQRESRLAATFRFIPFVMLCGPPIHCTSGKNAHG